MECTLKLVARDGEECELYNYKDDSTYVVPCNWCLDGGSDQNVSDKEEGVITSTGPGVVVLGVLVGLLVVLLVAVITGWLWTCWVMKNRKTDSRYSDYHESVSGTIRQLDNPIYLEEVFVRPSHEQATHIQKSTSEAIHAPLLPEVIDQSTTNQTDTMYGNEHEYDLQDRGQTEYHTTTTVMLQKHHSSVAGNERSAEFKKRASYSRGEQERLSEKNIAEEHIYHVLEGPTN